MFLFIHMVGHRLSAHQVDKQHLPSENHPLNNVLYNILCLVFVLTTFGVLTRVGSSWFPKRFAKTADAAPRGVQATTINSLRRSKKENLKRHLLIEG